MKKEKIFFLVGPTAVGKSQVAAFVAGRIKGEIISCDSMQVYKGMRVLTSHPPDALLEKIPHHLIGIIPPQKEFDVFVFRKQAVDKIREVLRRGRVPIVVGGTGLYMSVLLDGIFEGASASARIRKRLEDEIRTKGSGPLYLRLGRLDPEAASKIHPNDSRRSLFLLEVFEVTGKPISLLQKQRKGLAGDYKFKIICLTMKLPLLYKRIDKRVEQMFDTGLVSEVKRLRLKKLSKTASRAIGLREIGGYLRGDYDLSEARRLMSYNTRQYARRQLTWFRKDKRIKWLEIKEDQSVVQAGKRVLEEWKKRF